MTMLTFDGGGGGQGMSVLTSLFAGGKVPRDEHALWGRRSVQFYQ